MDCAIAVAPSKLPDGTPVDTFELSGLRYMIARVAEYALFGSVTHTGALNHALAASERTDPSYLRRSALPSSVTEAEFDTVLAVYRDFQLALDPLSTKKANAVSIVLVSDVCALAVERDNRALVAALGGEAPERWHLEAQQQELAEEGLVDVVLDERLEEMDVQDELDEQEAVQLQEEMNAFEPYAEGDEDAEKLSRYTLQHPSRHLRSQLAAYVEHKTKKLAFNRTSIAVENVTAESDVRAILRFLGWLHLTKKQPALGCLTLLRKIQPDVVEAYCDFLIGRPVQYGSIANYLNGLYNIFQYVQHIPIDSATDPISDSESDSEDPNQSNGEKTRRHGSDSLAAVVEATFNLRKQAEKEAKVQRLYRHRKPDWLSWGDARQTRLNVLEALKKLPRRQARDATVLLLEDALIIAFHTVMPPDRVGVIRRLAYNDTLKQHTDGTWYIDLTAFKHKTSRFYGPAKTPVSPQITPLLEQWLRATQSAFEFDQFDEDEERTRTRRRYLFHMKTDRNRCLTSSNWTNRVKVIHLSLY